MRTSEKITCLENLIHQVEKRQAKTKFAGLLLLVVGSAAIGGLAYGYNRFDSRVDDLKEDSPWGNCTTDGYRFTRDEQCAFPTNSTMTSESCTDLCAEIARYLSYRHLCYAGIPGMVLVFLIAVWLCFGAPSPRNSTNITMDSLNESIREFFNLHLNIRLHTQDFANDSGLLAILKEQLENQRRVNVTTVTPVIDQKQSIELQPLLTMGINSSNTSPPSSPRHRVTSPPPSTTSFLALD